MNENYMLDNVDEIENLANEVALPNKLGPIGDADVESNHSNLDLQVHDLHEDCLQVNDLQEKYQPPKL